MKKINLDGISEVGNGWFLLWITKKGEDCKYSEHFTLKSLKEHLNYVKDEYDCFVIPPSSKVFKGKSVLNYIEEKEIKQDDLVEVKKDCITDEDIELYGIEEGNLYPVTAGGIETVEFETDQGGGILRKKVDEVIVRGTYSY